MVMISETIIVAILALLGSLFGSYMTGSRTSAVMQEQIKVLSERVNKHNDLIERMYKCESDIKTAFLKIDELKDKIDG